MKMKCHITFIIKGVTFPATIQKSIWMTKLKSRVGDSFQCSFLFTRSDTRLSRVTRNKKRFKKKKKKKIQNRHSLLTVSLQLLWHCEHEDHQLTVRQRLRWFIDLFRRRIYLGHVWQNQTWRLKFHFFVVRVRVLLNHHCVFFFFFCFFSISGNFIFVGILF